MHFISDFIDSHNSIIFTQNLYLMNQEAPNSNNSNDEVDLIRLLDYFKNGIKSIFRKLWQLIEVFLRFFVLLKKNWPVVLGLTIAGAAYGFYKNFTKSESYSYEMVVHSNPVSNIELYAFSSELNRTDSLVNKSEGTDLIKKLGVKSLSVEPIEREEDVINNYFDQIEMAVLRNDQTDTLYYQSSEISAYKSKMKSEDYSLQKLKLKINGNTSLGKVQENLLGYLNNLPGPKSEQERKLAILTSYEKILNRSIQNIDSILASRATLNRNSGPSGTEQLLVNTASRGNVEADLLRYSELFSRKLYGTQKKISDYEKGIFVVSNLRLIEEKGILDNSILKYGLIGLFVSLLVVLLLEFNRFLSRYAVK